MRRSRIAACHLAAKTSSRHLAGRIAMVRVLKGSASASEVWLILPLFSVILKPPLCGLPVLLLGRDPALLKRHRADIAQRRVQSLVVVERQPSSPPCSASKAGAAATRRCAASWPTSAEMSRQKLHAAWTLARAKRCKWTLAPAPCSCTPWANCAGPGRL